MNDMWEITMEQYFEICDLALKHGKKAGDSMQEEFDEIRKKYQIQHLGCTDKDIDMLTGELRDKGKKVLNLNEEERKRKRKNNEKEN
jgi:hypothetical protein